MDKTTYVPFQTNQENIKLEPTVILPPTPNTTQKAAVGAIIVVVSIIAVLLIATVSFYFLQDPWEYPETVDSTVNKDYFKDQYSYYAYSPIHQSPYLLNHLYAPVGNISYIPHSVTRLTLNEKFQFKSFNPIFELKFAMLGESLGLTRLRRKGIIFSAYDVLEKWKRDNFFPSFDKFQLNRLVEGKELPNEITTEIQLSSNIPTGFITFLYQNGDKTTETRIATQVKIISCEIHNGTSINLYILPVIENAAMKEFFSHLVQHYQPMKDSQTPFYQCFKLECHIYNPELSNILFEDIAPKLFSWSS